jgi:bacterioferritin-associated ferredoxin
MYVCLCVGATNHTVCDAVSRGASTCKEVAALCGAGGDCGRCRRTLRAIISAERVNQAELQPASSSLGSAQKSA